jgi:hypothetical protein
MLTSTSATPSGDQQARGAVPQIMEAHAAAGLPL